MKVPAVLPLLIFILVSSPLIAQTSPTILHAPDSGTWVRMNSITIPAINNAPFSATVTAQWTRTLEDGTSVILQNHRFVTRDSAGRIFQERRQLVPAGQEPNVTWIEISDPATHTKYFCYPKGRICEARNYRGPALVAAAPTGLVKDGKEFFSRENLGTSTISGLDVTGTRETRTISAGVRGNDRDISITKEFWFSPQLGINLSVKRINPLQGTQTFTVSNISLTDSGAQYFSIPAGYTAHDQRQGPRAASAPVH